MIVGSAVAAGILAGAYFGMAIYFCFHFLPGTRINGMDCSMKTAEGFQHELEKSVEDYTLTVTVPGALEQPEVCGGNEGRTESAESGQGGEKAGYSRVISGREIDLELASEDQAQSILEKQAKPERGRFMKQTVYIDVLVLVNLLVNYFLLLLVRSFLHVQAGRGRLFLGALAGALGSLVILLPQPHWSVGLFYRLALSAVMTAVCFCPVSPRLFWKLLGLLYLAAFGFAGFMLALWAMGQSSGLLMNNGILYLPVSPMLLLLLAAAAYLVMKLLHRITGPREPGSRFCTVSVRSGSRKVVFQGKVDTGSTLTAVIQG